LKQSCAQQGTSRKHARCHFFVLGVPAEVVAAWIPDDKQLASRKPCPESPEKKARFKSAECILPATDLSKLEPHDWLYDEFPGEVADLNRRSRKPKLLLACMFHLIFV